MTSQLTAIILLVIIVLIMLAALGLFVYSVWSKHAEDTATLPDISRVVKQNDEEDVAGFELPDESELGGLENSDADRMMQELRSYQS